MHSATALRPFSRALSCGKKNHGRARAGGGWWKYRSHSRNATAAALATKMPPSATRSVVGVTGRGLAMGVARSGTGAFPAYLVDVGSMLTCIDEEQSERASPRRTHGASM